MRRILAVMAGSRPTACATLDISISGSRAKAMISEATREGLGKSICALRRFSKSCGSMVALQKNGTAEGIASHVAISAAPAIDLSDELGRPKICHPDEDG